MPNRSYFALKMADQWLSWRLDVIASLLILCVALLAISSRGKISPSLIAITLTEVGARSRGTAEAAALPSAINPIPKELLTAVCLWVVWCLPVGCARGSRASECGLVPMPQVCVELQSQSFTMFLQCKGSAKPSKPCKACGRNTAISTL